MFALCSKVEINGQSFDGVNEIKINRSIHLPGATAVIKVPVTAVLKQKNETTTSIETAKAIKVRDPVTISLGYNGKMNLEFKGYVRRLNYHVPLEIECEDAFFLARGRPITLSGKMTLKECLQKCGLQVAEAVDLTMTNFVEKDSTVAAVIGKLKTDYGLNLFFDMQDRIYATRPFGVVSGEARYELRNNVISDNGLKYLLASDTKMEVNAVCWKKDGTKVTAKIGESGGIVKNLYFYDVEDMAQLKGLAERELCKYSRDGYEGKIETFLFPYAEPCMKAVLKDPTYPERDGSYYIEGVETLYGTKGARRHVSLGIKI